MSKPTFKHYRVKNDLQSPEIGNTADLKLDNYIETLKYNLKFEIISLTDEEIVFDLIGADTSIANALRRILLAEVAQHISADIS